MNKVILIGRLVKDPELKTTASQIAFCGFTIAVDRKFKNANGEKQADFIAIVAWRQTAEFIAKYFSKGSKIGIIGTIQTRKFEDKDGKTVYVTEVVADEAEFVDSKQSGTNEGSRSVPAAPSVDNGFYPAMDDDTTLPFDL